MNKRISILLILLFLVFNLFPAETKLIGNFIKLIVTNNDGRFLLYGRNNMKQEWVPLVFENFPPTSYFRFFKNHNKISFGEEGEGRISDIKINDNLINYYWQDNDIKIEIQYQLVSSNIKESANTLYIDLIINNLTDKEYSLDYFFCIDTYLGENKQDLSADHFILPSNLKINKEEELLPEIIPSFIQTFNQKLDIGLNIVFNKEKQINPSKVYLANWKKVEENIGLYKVITGRDFDLKPYSINDSAVFIEYDKQMIIPNRKSAYRFILTMINDTSINKQTVDKIEPEKNIPDKSYKDINNKGLDLLNMSLADLLALLDNINKKLENGQILKDEDVELINNILTEIKKRRNYQ